MHTPKHSLSQRRLRPLLASDRAARECRVLDIATGAGEIPLELARLAATGDMRLCIDGCDINPTAVQHARQRAL